jgi:hypothetical protein
MSQKEPFEAMHSVVAELKRLYSIEARLSLFSGCPVGSSPSEHQEALLRVMRSWKEDRA